MKNQPKLKVLRSAKLIAVPVIVQMLVSAPVLAQPKAQQVTLTLREYLNQVENQNDAFQRASRAEKAFELRADEWRLLTSPYFFGSAELTSDKSEKQTPQIMGTETNIKRYTLGFGQKTSFGLEAKLSYQYLDTNMIGANEQFINPPHFYTTGPVLELTQSFWKNGFGSETRAQSEIKKAEAESQRYSEKHNQAQLRQQAESAYWRLAVAREALHAAKDNLERAKKGRNWTAERVRLNLADRSDLLQQDAAVAARELEVQQAEMEEKAAARAFNTMRGVASTEVAEQLQPITDELIKSLRVPERAEKRADVMAAEAQARLAKAQSETGLEALKPTLDAYLTAGLNGRDGDSGKAVSESFSTEFPNYTVGVRLNIPLNQGIASRAREGYRVSAATAELQARRKAFEVEREWIELMQKFEESKQRLELARKLERVQKTKLDAERARLSRGRTTTYQVIQFETEYATAQLNRIKQAQEVLSIYSQLKTFGGEQ